MSYAAAQARYDAMTDDHPDDDIGDMDIDTLREALYYSDCEELSGRRWRNCQHREELMKSRLKELEAEL
ncbi:MAG: hypothetical protein EOM24_29960 [Chloroflexia bacterium]|nr:hypothetical protein [Chloroflexia bacterium]